MSRLRKLVISMLTLAGLEVVRVGLIGQDPLFSSGFEFTMTAFAAAWLADEAQCKSDKQEGGKA